MGIRRNIITRMAVIYFLMLMMGIIAGIKILLIQHIKTEHLQQIAENLNNNTVITEATRGNIYADDYSVLATSVPGYFVRMDLAAPGVMEVYDQQSDSLAICLANLFKDASASQYKQKLDAAYRSKNRGLMLTPRKIDYHELQKVKDFPILRRGQNRGGRIIETENIRILPFGSLAARTIGTLNKGAYGGVHGNIGYTGIEGAFETYLKGKPGVGYKQNLSGRWIVRTEIEARDGMDVVTTLTIKLQDIVENALLKQLEKSQAEWGTAILMEVQTGKIKAIANFGASGKQTGSSGNQYAENYNYALGHAGCYEPGSTFKLMSLMVALEQGRVDTSDVFDTGNGIWQYKDRKIYDSDWRYGGHGKMTVKEIFEKSSNVGVAKIITSCYEDCPEEYVDRLYGFGLNKPLELEIKGEGIPSMKYPGDKDWWGTSLAWMSYGYELKLTPLQVLTFYNAVANNGKMVKPSFIKEISRGGLVVKSFNPEVLNPMIVSSETLAKAKKMLEGVCETGTGQSLSNPVFKIAGKTGTAQIVANGEYGEGLYLASFAGYFPADDPVYSLIVTLNRPKGAYYGGSVAGPVFKEIAEKVYAATFGISRQIVSMKPEKNTILPEFKNGRREDVQKIIDCLKIESNLAPVHSEFVEMKKTDNHIEWEEITVASGKVPDVSGMVASDAVFLLENAGLKVKIQGTGRVRKQSLLPGAEYRYGQWIFITLS